MTAKKTIASHRSPRRSKNTRDAGYVVVENVNHPGKRRHVSADNYRAMRRTLLKVLPHGAPGFTQAEMIRAALLHLPADLFPGGAKAGWWMKTVQLDLEAKRIIARERTTPLRWHRS
jgi:hypothetical protein